MSNGEESGKSDSKMLAELLGKTITGKTDSEMLAELPGKTMTGKETLSAVLQRMSESHKGDTLRMRAALALAMLDGSLDIPTARLIGDVINGKTG